jgi:high-affinity iron transporter
MGIAFLKMDKSRVKWRLKLADAFEKSHAKAVGTDDSGNLIQREEGRSGKWALFLLPFITVVRVSPSPPLPNFRRHLPPSGEQGLSR